MADKPKSFDEAVKNLQTAAKDVVIAFATVMAPVLKDLKDKGLIDEHGNLTVEGKKKLK